MRIDFDDSTQPWKQEIHMHPSNLRLNVLWIFITLVLTSGCSQLSGAVSHGWEGDEYENTYLSSSSPLGAKALQNWRDLDIDVRQYVRKYGKPDVIYSKYMSVTFFYLKVKLQVRFDRPAVGTHTKITKTIMTDKQYKYLSQRF